MSILVMDTFKKMKRRTLIRIASFIVATMVVLGGLGIYGFYLAGRYRMKLEYTYQRALNELGTNVTNIDIALNKGLYATSPSQMVVLSTRLSREADHAKSSLGQLPTEGMDLTNTSRFLSQVGEYSMFLARKVVNNERVTEEETKTLDHLTELSKAMRKELSGLQTALNEGAMTIGKVEKLVNLQQSEESKETKEASTLGGFEDIESAFENYPTLIYDGPFSDHIFQKDPQMIKDKPEVSLEQAKKTAADFLGLDLNQLEHSGDEGGNMPSYVFGAENITISVTKKGGAVCYYLNSRETGQDTIDQNTASQKAKEFLNKRKIGPVTESYFQTTNGICTINFAYLKDNVTCYTDLIKVSVAMDTGEIVGYDARGFIMNHKDRTLEKPTKSISEVQAALSPRLKVETNSIALIPTSGTNEVLCYEFKCKGKDNEDVIVYVNAKTGNEEQILILEHTDGGVLAY